MKWLNALAIFLQFASFWLVAPEIIGEKTLSRISLALKKMISNLSLIFMVMLIAFYAIFFAARGIITGMEASQNSITQSEMNKYYIQVSISTVIYAVFMVFYKRSGNGGTQKFQLLWLKSI
ncbi:MAG: hypothetical protein IPP71_11335 [Bacteroidetes bacterium]|nr:hypothetical protein [Bacteroidota bacterium]